MLKISDVLFANNISVTNTGPSKLSKHGTAIATTALKISTRFGLDATSIQERREDYFKGKVTRLTWNVIDDSSFVVVIAAFTRRNQLFVAACFLFLFVIQRISN